mmetsp:Transcript_118885/g.167025  ORF Transcript_118885/g.167025 Transcript_118885/m.167025 type:complete len:117 (+) Transcript_118885:48-398(+)
MGAKKARSRSPARQRQINKKRAATLDDQKKKIIADRPKLKKGISLEDIQNNYWREEIVEVLKQNGIPSGAKKSVLNQRLYDFLSTGQKPAPKAPKRKKAAASKKKKSKKAKDAAKK